MANLAVRMFVVDHKRQVLIDLPHLMVTVPKADYLLAMKILALRPQTEDESDARFLIERLNLASVEEVSDIVGEYYPHKKIKHETLFWLEEYFKTK